MLKKKKETQPEPEQQPAITFVICRKGYFYSIGDQLIPASKFERQHKVPSWMREPDPQFLNC